MHPQAQTSTAKRKLSIGVVALCAIASAFFFEGQAHGYYNAFFGFKQRSPSLIFTTSAQAIYHGLCSTVVTVQTRNGAGAPTNVGSNLTVNLTGTAGLTFYSDATCTTLVTDVTVTSGTSSAGFYFLSASAGTKTVTADATGYTSYSQDQTLTSNPFIWIGGGGDALWSTALNWSGGAAPSTTADVAVFNTTCVSNCSPTIAANINIGGIRASTGYSGTITQNTGITITLGTLGWIHASGTFAGGDSAITLGGDFTISSGTFTSTSATMTLTKGWTTLGTPTFTHNSGTVLFNGGTSTNSIVAGTSPFNNLTFQGNNGTYNVTGTMTANGTLTLANSYSTSSGVINGGILAANGDIAFSAYGYVGTTLVKITGSGNQTVTGVATALIPSLEIASTGGTVTYSGTLLLRYSYTHTSGTVDATGTTVKFAGYGGVTNAIVPGATAFNVVDFVAWGGTYNITGTMTVNGALTLANTYSTSGTLTGGTIVANGNVTTASYGYGGSTVIKVSGSGNQSITGIATAYVPAFEVASTGGTVTFLGTLLFWDNYTYTTGTIDVGTSTLVFSGTTSSSHTFTPGAGISYNNVTFTGYSVTTNIVGTLTVLGTLSVSDTNSSSGSLSGTIEAKGNVNFSSYGKGGSPVFNISGSGNQTITGVANAKIQEFNVISTGGTVTYSGSLYFNKDYTVTSGTVDPGTSTVTFYRSSSTATITIGTEPYNDVVFGGYAAAFTLVGTMTVNGTLTLTDGNNSSTRTVNSGTINANGNVSVTSFGKSGTAILNLAGATSTTLTIATGALRTSGTVTVAKTGGSSVTLMSDTNYGNAGQSLTVSSGTLDIGGYALTVTNILTIDPGATLRCSAGTYTAGTLTNNGTLNCPGNAAYEFNWTGTTADGNWNTAGNWQGGAVPGATTGYAYFDDTYCGANCSVTMNATVNAKGVELTSGYSGTITQGSGIGVTIGSRGWTQAAGTFTGSDGAVALSGPFAFSGGTYTATSATTAVSVDVSAWSITGAATFNHNSGTISFYSSYGPYTIVPGTVIYNNILIQGWAPTYSLSSGSMTIAGNLTLSNSSGSTGNINSGTLNVAGNVTSSNRGLIGSALVRVVGSGNQTVTGAPIASFNFPQLEIASTGGIVSLTGDIGTSTYTYTSGTVDASTSNIVFGGLGASSCTPGGVNYNNVTLTGSTSASTLNLNSGTLNVLGTLTFNHAVVAGGSINTGTINAAGNVSITGGGSFAGSANLNFSGTSNTTLTSTGTLKVPGATVTIAKTGGAKVTMANAMLMNSTNQDLTISTGATLDMAGYALTVARNITNSGTLQRGTNPTCGAVTQGGTYSGNAAVCP